jgi:phosphate uptake regulator
MDQRKLIKLGNSSYAIALPKNWVDKSGLGKGDNVFLEENSHGEIIVQANYKEPSEEGMEISLNLNNKSDKEIEREISSSYVKGYDTLKIQGLCKEKRKYAEYLLKSLISFEIIDKDKESIIAKDFFDLKGANLSKFLRRTDNILKGMLEETEEVLQKGEANDKKLKELYDLDWEINRIYFLVYRIFIKGLNNPSLLNLLKTDNLSLLNKWQIAVKIGELGDEIKGICSLINKKNNKKITSAENEKILLLYKRIRESYSELILGHYNKDTEKIKKVSLYRQELLSKSDKLLESEDLQVSKIGEKFKNITSLIHELSKLNLYTLVENADED